MLGETVDYSVLQIANGQKLHDLILLRYHFFLYQQEGLSDDFYKSLKVNSGNFSEMIEWFSVTQGML